LTAKKTLFDTSFNGSGEYFGLLFDRTYDDIEIPEQYPDGALLILTDGGRKYPSSFNGRTEPDIDCSEYRISEGLLWAVSSGKKTGLYSAELEEIYPQQADEITVFHSGLNNGTGSYINGALIFFVKKDGKLACFTNYAGSTKQRSEFIYDSIEITTLGRSLAARRGGRPYGICSDGNEKGLDYDVIYKNSGISVIKYDLPLGCGMIDKDDNTVIPFEYAGITATDEGTFLCSGIKGEDGVIFDEKGQLISEGFRFVYRLSAPDGKNTRYICEKDMKHVLIDAYGNKISIGPEYSDIEYGENDTYVLITETGNVTVDKNGSILG
jgi:hypothetical protein